MSRLLLYLHVVATIAAYCLLGLAYVFVSRMTQVSTGNVILTRSITVFAAIGLVTGFWWLAVTLGKNKAVVMVAVSTIADFLLFILSL